MRLQKCLCFLETKEKDQTQGKLVNAFVLLVPIVELHLRFRGASAGVLGVDVAGNNENDDQEIKECGLCRHESFHGTIRQKFGEELKTIGRKCPETCASPIHFRCWTQGSKKRSLTIYLTILRQSNVFCFMCVRRR